MPNAILRAGPFAVGGDSFVNQPTSASQATPPVNCNKRSWSSDNWKYYVGGLTSGQYKNVSSNNATVSETVSPDSGAAFLEFDGISFAYQAAQSFTLSGTYSGTCASGQQDNISFVIRYVTIGSDAHTTLFEDAASQNISGSYSVTFPAAVKPKVADFIFTSETTGNGTVVINGINPS